MSVYKPKNSSNYHFRYMLNGKIHTGSCKTSNKALAEKFEHNHKQQSYQARILGEGDQITIREALQNFLDTKRKMASYQSYINRSNKIMGQAYDRTTHETKPCFGFDPDRKLETIGEKDVHRLVVEREKEGMGPQTILHELTVLNQTLKVAKRMGYKTQPISFSDIKKDNAIKPGKGKIRYLSADEESRLLKELDPYRKGNKRGLGGKKFEDMTKDEQRSRIDSYDFVVMLLDTGARQGEVAELKWTSIDLLDRTITLFRPKVQNQSTLHMTDRLYEILFRRHQNPNRGQFVFENNSGEARSYTPTAFKNACDRAGIENCSFHTLRHTFATKMVQNGLPLADLQQILGHSNLVMTLRYSHLAPSQSSAKAVVLLNKINQPKPLLA